MELKYEINKTFTPDWCNGYTKVISKHLTPEDAVIECEKLSDNDPNHETTYDVVVSRDESN